VSASAGPTRDRFGKLLECETTHWSSCPGTVGGVRIRTRPTGAHGHRQPTVPSLSTSNETREGRLCDVGLRKGGPRQQVRLLEDKHVEIMSGRSKQEAKVHQESSVERGQATGTTAGL